MLYIEEKVKFTFIFPLDSILSYCSNDWAVDTFLFNFKHICIFFAIL